MGGAELDAHKIIKLIQEKFGTVASLAFMTKLSKNSEKVKD